MALKTTPNDADVQAYLDSVADEEKRTDCQRILELMQSVTGEAPKMWGSALIGFGSYHYKYESGREGDWFLTGFSPRKNNLSLYIMAGFDRHEALMSQLGKYKTGKSCLYIKRLADIEVNVLKELIEESVKYMKARYA